MNPDVPGGIDAVVLRAISRDPTDRFRNVDEILKALGTHLPPDFSGGTEVAGFLQKHYDVARERDLIESDVARGRGFLHAAGQRTSDPEPPEPTSNSRSHPQLSLVVGAAAVGLLVAIVVMSRHPPPTSARSGSVATVRPIPTEPPLVAAEPPAFVPSPPSRIAPVPVAPLPKAGPPPRRVRVAAPGRAREIDRAASDPSAATALLTEGQRRFDTGDIDGALQSARAAIRGGGGAPAHLLAGRALGKLNQVEDAERELAVAVRLDPTNALAAQRLREVRKRLHSTMTTPE
jgi:hypothetical protein